MTDHPAHLPSPEEVDRKLREAGLKSDPAPKLPRQKFATRAVRWTLAIGNLMTSYQDAEAHAAIRTLQSEYKVWFDRLPPTLQTSFVGFQMKTLADASISADRLIELRNLPHPVPVL